MALTHLEQRLLFELSTYAGEVRTHAELLPRIWGPAHSGRTGAVRTLVKQLRRKLGDDAECPAYVIKVPLVGYHLVAPQPPPAEPPPDAPDGVSERYGPGGRTHDASLYRKWSRTRQGAGA